MSSLTKEDMQNVMRDVLLERGAIGGEEHHNDHEFIRLLQEREVRRQARVEKFKLSLIGTLATGLVGMLVWIGKVVVDHWK